MIDEDGSRFRFLATHPGLLALLDVAQQAREAEAGEEGTEMTDVEWLFALREAIDGFRTTMDRHYHGYGRPGGRPTSDRRGSYAT